MAPGSYAGRRKPPLVEQSPTGVVGPYTRLSVPTHHPTCPDLSTSDPTTHNKRRDTRRGGKREYLKKEAFSCDDSVKRKQDVIPAPSPSPLFGNLFNRGEVA